MSKLTYKPFPKAFISSDEKKDSWLNKPFIEIGAACDHDIEMKVRILNSLLSPPACIYWNKKKQWIKWESAQSYVKFKMHFFLFFISPKLQVNFSNFTTQPHYIMDMYNFILLATCCRSRCEIKSICTITMHIAYNASLFN